jgi:hypothetical protein
MQANIVLVRDCERLRDVTVEGNLKELDAFAEQVLATIMIGVQSVK